MNDPQIPWPIVSGVGAFFSAIFVAIGAWWCTSMQKDIKSLQDKEQGTQVILAGLLAANKSREDLQDARWHHLGENIERIGKDVQAMVHSKINK